MRVLTVARWYPSHDSPGRGSFVADLVRASAAAGVQARVVSFDRVLVRGRREDREAIHMAARAAFREVANPAALFVSHGDDGFHVPVARVPVVRRPGTGDPDALIDDHLEALRPFLGRMLETWRPDVIHAHTGLPDGIVAASLGREHRIPVVVSEHMSTIETELADPAALAAYRALLDPGVQLVGVSPSMAGRVAALLDVPAERLGVLPNPVAAEAFVLADPANRDRNELLWVGSIGEHKGIEVLIEAFALVRDRRPGLRLRLIGGERAPGDSERLRALASSRGVEGSMSFDGWLTRAQVAAAMARAAVFVHPSPSETFGVAAAEAILTGLPVASRRSGGVPWIIGLSGGLGRVATGDDPESFAVAIEATLDGPLGIDAAAARARLVEAVGAPSVARQARALYEAGAAGAETGASASGARAGAGTGAGTSGARAGAPLQPPGIRTEAAPPIRAASLPHVLVATERIQAPALVAALPTELQDRLVFVVPPPTPGVAEPHWAGVTARVVTADPVVPGTPRPRGRSPLARLRRALWRPAPTADALLRRAVDSAVRRTSTGRGPVGVVAIDAPAAILISELDPARIRLAPGALRWLADRWAVERDRLSP